MATRLATNTTALQYYCLASQHPCNPSLLCSPERLLLFKLCCAMLLQPKAALTRTLPAVSMNSVTSLAMISCEVTSLLTS
jgi:hypothetical protein